MTHSPLSTPHSPLPWYDRLHLVSMLLMAAAMPIDFHCGLWAAALLGLTSIVKMVAQRHIGNRSLSRPLRVALGSVVVYWFLHVVSIAYGGDPSTGWRVVELKSVLMIFVLAFLLTDTGYLREDHFRWFFYALWVSMCGVFLYYVGMAVGGLIGGKSAASAFGVMFDPRHHAYTALYIDTALAFVYVELVSRWSVLKPWPRVLLIASVLCLITYVLMVNSRAGILVMWIVTAICVLHLSVFRRRWWQALLLATLFSGFTLGMEAVLPGHSNRIASTIENVASVAGSDEGDDEEDMDDEDAITPDARISINKSAFALSLQRPLFGYGASRYRAALAERYEADGYEYGAKRVQNAHNQYLETVLSVGSFGLLLLLVFFLLPLWRAWKGRRYFLPALLMSTIVCINLLFESMLERQMGLLFIGYFMTLIVLLINIQENKFGQ